MADDITLTVRVRDLSRGELTRLNQQMNRLQRDFNRSSLASRGASQGFRRLGTDINRLNSQLNQMQSSGRLTSRELSRMNGDLRLITRGLRQARREGTITGDRFRSMTRDVTLLRSRMIILGRDGNVFTRMAAHATLFQQRVRDANSHASGLRRTLGRMGDLGLSGIIPTLRGIGLMIGAMRQLGTWIKTNRRFALLFIGTLLLIGPAAQALGALLLTALGGAFLALGAFALRADKDVKSAFNSMKGTIGATVRSAAQPIRGALVNAMNQVASSARKMEPALTNAFREAAPLVDDLAGAFTGFASAALPGFTAALRNSGPAMQGFREAMTMIGDGFGDMFQIMTAGEGGQALKQVWIDLGTELRNLLVGIGEFISTASQSGTATTLMIGFFRTLNGVLNLVAGTLEALDPLFNIFAKGLRSITEVDVAMGGMASSFDASTASVDQLREALKTADAEIKRIKDLQDSFKDVKGPAKNTFLETHKATEEDLADALAAREDLLTAVATAEAKAAGATNQHTNAISELIAQIQNLADLNRNYLDARSAQAEALNKATEGLKEHGNSLKFVNGELDLTSTASQEAYKLLSDLGRATSESTRKAEEAGAPWESIRQNWQKGFNDIVTLADGMGLSAEQARILAEQIVGIPPSKDIWIRARAEQAREDIERVIEAFKAAPNSHTVTVETLTADAIAALEAVGFKITRLPDGKTVVTTDNSQSITAIEQTEAALAALDGQTASTYANHYETTFRNVINGGGSSQAAKNAAELARIEGSATGGLIPRYASGGGVAAAPNGFIMGPGTGTSDSILAAFASGAVGRISNTEFVVNAKSTRKHLPLLEAINSDRLDRLKLPGFAKGGKTKNTRAAKQAKAEREARNDARSSFMFSHFGRMAGYKHTGFRKELALSDTLGDLVSALNKWRSTIMKATHGALEKNLLRTLDKAGRSLINHQKNLAKVDKQLDAARNRLSALKQAAASLRESITTGVLSATNITGAVTGDKTLTITDIMQRMRSGADKSTAFANAIKELKAKGFSGTIIKQVAEAGIEGGGLETATALLRASSSEIETINELQKQINSNAKAAGKTTADIMYGSGIKAAEGLVKGLTAKKKAIESAMMAIAKAMEKAIKKALGIKSPSKVMEQVGDFTAEGFARGMTQNRNVGHAWTSMLTTPSGGMGTTSGTSTYGSGGAQYVIPIYIGNKVVDEVWLDTGRRVVRTRGGDVQRILGR